MRLVVSYFPARLRVGRCVMPTGRRRLESAEGRRGSRPRFAGAGPDRGGRNGFLYPVLKHGPRSLTYVRVQGWQTPVRNESDSGWTCVGHNPPAIIPWENGLSVSIHVGTRKMVNYA